MTREEGEGFKQPSMPRTEGHPISPISTPMPEVTSSVFGAAYMKRISLGRWATPLWPELRIVSTKYKKN